MATHGLFGKRASKMGNCSALEKFLPQLISGLNITVGKTCKFRREYLGMVETCLRAEIDGDVLALSMTSAKPHYPALIEVLTK